MARISPNDPCALLERIDEGEEHSYAHLGYELGADVDLSLQLALHRNKEWKKQARYFTVSEIPLYLPEESRVPQGDIIWRVDFYAEREFNHGN